MKLELKHINPYLPYGLKIRNNKTTFEMIHQFKPNDLNVISLRGVLELPFENKPILRPLSDLTKEIEVNGEKFVPMIRLLYLYETNYFHENENLKFVTFDLSKIISCEHKKYKLLNQENFIVNYLVPTENLGILTYSFTYDPEIRRFAFRDETRKTPFGVAFQLDLFDKLFEWHFDVFGLIPNGLAIDINLLNKE